MKEIKRGFITNFISFLLIGAGIFFLFASVKGMPKALNTLRIYNCSVELMIIAVFGLTGILGITIGITILRLKRHKT